MFARNVSIHLKSNVLSDYTRTFENDTLPLLRKQKGFRDEITLSNPGSLDVIAISLWDSKADRKSTRLNSSHLGISYAGFFFKCHGAHGVLRYFPTRRSSDLQKGFRDEITLSNPGSLDVIAISLWDSK